MPALEMAQDTGKLIQWLKAEGDQVVQGEPMMEIETDKVTVEIEAPATGVLANVIAAPGDDVPVGQVIALILAPGEAAPAKPALPVPSAAVSTDSKPVAPRPPTPKPGPQAPRVVNASPVALRVAAEHGVDLSLVKPTGGRIEKADVLAFLALTSHPGLAVTPHPSSVSRERGEGPEWGVRASPKARRLAQERGVDIAVVTGSGPEGAVLAADVTAVTDTPAPAPTVGVSTIWRVMAERMTQSWISAPHFYLVREVNARRLLAWHERAQSRAEEKITITDLLVKLTAAALRTHPRVNAAWQDDAILMNEQVNVGLAVAVEEGLIVPVVHRADVLGVREIAVRRHDIVTRALAGRLQPEDIRGGTFTLSNLGMYGVDAFNAVINPPQAAILAVGRIAERVAPVDGQPAVQPMLTLTLSCDHRVVDGARGAQFLQSLASLIEEPLLLFD